MSVASELSAETLARQLDALQRNPDVRIAGSIGRSVLYGQYARDPMAEFAVRGEELLVAASGPRDIDVLGISESPPPDLGPFVMDMTSFASPQITIQREGSVYRLKSSRHHYQADLDPAVMEPVHGVTAFGIPITTVPYQTHVSLIGLVGTRREKDITNLAMLKRLGAEHGLETLDPDLYEPFRTLEKLNRGDWYPKARKIYRAVVPEAFRTRVQPFRRISKKLMHIG